MTQRTETNMKEKKPIFRRNESDLHLNLRRMIGYKQSAHRVHVSKMLYETEFNNDHELIV